MALSKQALKELRDELTDLRRRRNEIRAKIKGIEAILRGELVKHPATSSGRRKGPRKEPDAPRSAKGAFNRSSLREHVVQVLQRAPRSKGAEITRSLEAAGFRVGGKTSLLRRVSHELYRLRRIGVLRKTRKGRYVLATAAQPSRAAERAGSPGESPVAG